MKRIEREKEIYWRIKYDQMYEKHSLLLENWKKLLVKEVDNELQMLEKDALIFALQKKIMRLTKW